MAEAPPDWLEMPDGEFHDRYRPAGNPTSSYLHRVLIRALGPAVTKLPSNEALRAKPLVVDLALPLPSRLRIYLYGATQHPSERQQGTFKIQLTVGVPRDGQPANSKNLYFDRSDDIRPILAGYQPDQKLFILWDADLHDVADGFPYSKNVQAPPDLVWHAVARGLAQDTRRLKRPPVTESIVAARPRQLAKALQVRIRLSNAALCDGLF
ncbi:hypothetical protein [Polymorphospora rubra]|uniref:Methylase-associated X1 domain-containing protein n=1 Tax=Polymorphospora rubra TaxID=338584 RepID=A0A810N9D3_9ACTN|nr:hypothetical protein [Polymorphospora rubra]BCJ69670.1 hypothetical protein Prubr_66910 [Polymorphospora rubra]